MKSRTILSMSALALFLLYVITCCRTVGPGDSGELTVVMSRWGIAHAPGATSAALRSLADELD